MTREELKTDESKYIIELVIKDKLSKEAEEWLCNNLHSASEEDFIKAMVDIAEPREKQIKALGERCLQLQKDKGNLTDKVRDLEAQNEQMRCCGNCEWKAKGVCNGNDTCGLKEWKLVETRR